MFGLIIVFGVFVLVVAGIALLRFLTKTAIETAVTVVTESQKKRNKCRSQANVLSGIAGLAFVAIPVSFAFLNGEDFLAAAAICIVIFIPCVIIAASRQTSAEQIDREQQEHESPQKSAGINPEIATKKYFQFLQQIELFEKERKFDQMLVCCKKSLPLIPIWIQHEKQEYGRFDVRSIPAIEIGAKYWGIMGMREELQNLERSVASNPDLSPLWLPIVKHAYWVSELSARLAEYIYDNPGCEQRDMARILNADKDEVAIIIHVLEATGNINRARKGSTFSLYMVTEAAVTT